MDGDDFAGKVAAVTFHRCPLVVFLIANYVMYMYAQKNLPPKKKKPVSKKKLKREKLKQGVPVPGE